MKSFWRDEQRDLTIYNTDACEVMREFHDPDRFDLAVTDPPYNRAMGYQDAADDLAAAAYEAWSEEWFREACDLCDTIVFTCGMQNIGMWERIEQPTWWLAWDTVNRLMKRTPLGYNRWEPVAVYGTAPQPIPDIFQAPIISEDNPVDHPCPKPLDPQAKQPLRCFPPCVCRGTDCESRRGFAVYVEVGNASLAAS